MVRLLSSWLWLTLPLLTMSCDDGLQTLGTAGSGTGGSTSTGSSMPMGDPMPCEVEALFASRCQQCHGEEPKFGATRVMLTQTDLASNGIGEFATLAEVCAARMALPSEDEERMPLNPQPPATMDELMVVEDWIDAGLPARDPADTCQ